MANALRSMPAQKPRPAPVITPAVSPSSVSSCSTAASTPWARSVSMAFIASGRLRVISSTRPRVSVSTASGMAATLRKALRSARSWGLPSISCSPASSRSSAGSPSATATGCASPARACSTTSSSVRRSPSTAAASPSSQWGDGWWEADVSDETWKRTSLGDLSPGDAVNLERPVRLSDRLGGHLVQGHVDGVGEIVDPAPDLRVRCATTSCGTSSRRARSPSTASASPWSTRSTTVSPSPSSRTPPR